MTSQQEANAALAIYQAARNEPRAVAESMLDQFFNFPSQDEYERDLDVIRRVLERKS
jgi:hypothetical protein